MRTRTGKGAWQSGYRAKYFSHGAAGKIGTGRTKDGVRTRTWRISYDGDTVFFGDSNRSSAFTTYTPKHSDGVFFGMTVWNL